MVDFNVKFACFCSYHAFRRTPPKKVKMSPFCILTEQCELKADVFLGKVLRPRDVTVAGTHVSRQIKCGPCRHFKAAKDEGQFSSAANYVHTV